VSEVQASLCFAVSRWAVRKERRAELATNKIEGRIFKRQPQSIRLALFNPIRCKGYGLFVKQNVASSHQSQQYRESI
jgi:hypothetical protein